jgi:guanosine-diphosphatase
MRPNSPRTAQYERLEDGMLGVPARAVRRIGWQRLLFGAAVVMCFLYVVSPSAPVQRVGGMGRPDPLDPLEPVSTTIVRSLYPVQSSHYLFFQPPDVSHTKAPTSSSQIKSPISFEADPDPSKTVHCTVAHPSAKRLVQYALMIDAGSTGSRIHVYKFNNCGPSPQYEYETFLMVKGGLSSFATDPAGGAHSLDVLLKEAKRVVPKDMYKCTPVQVKATAGLRMLGVQPATAILEAVRSHLMNDYPFPIHGGETGVAIMDGSEEGVYAWVTANYLLGSIGGSSSAASSSAGSTPRSHAVLDLGGASTQIVFEPAFEKGGKLSDGDHKYDLKFSGTNHVLYQHSYLGYGLMKARVHVHQLVDFMASLRTEPTKTSKGSKTSKEEPEIANPCLARDTRRRVELEDPRSASSSSSGTKGAGAATAVEASKYNVTMVGADIGSWEACNRVVELVLAKDAVCLVKPCSFNGVYQPSLLETFKGGRVLLLSYFYDRLGPLHADTLGEDAQAQKARARLTVGTFAEDARTVCAGEEAWKARWGSDEDLMDELRGRPEWCLDLTFQHALLRLGYEFDASHPVAIGKQIKGTELGWCLGATLAMVAGELVCRAE